MTQHTEISKVIMDAVDAAQKLNHSAVYDNGEKPVFTRMDFCVECDWATLDKVVSDLSGEGFDVAVSKGTTRHAIYVEVYNHFQRTSVCP